MSRAGLLALCATCVAIAGATPATAAHAEHARDTVATAAPRPPLYAEPLAWRNSTTVGRPWAGRLDDGIRLPREGLFFFTWDPVLKRTPNRNWRRWGSDRLVRVLLDVLAGFAATHPLAPRIGVGDLSRPHGGDFGRRFGGLGHVSHQNGLDADIYYPRRDRCECPARRPSQVDTQLAQELVDRFVTAGAERVFVGPNLPLRGPRGIVQQLPHHDNHLHVRLANDT